MRSTTLATQAAPKVPLIGEPTCRQCGCTELQPCIHPATGMTCAWVEKDLCDFCSVFSPFAVEAAYRSENTAKIETLQFCQRAAMAHMMAQNLGTYSREDHTLATNLFERVAR